MNFWFLAAASLSAVICAIHVILGGREAARPLLAARDIDRVAKFTNYYCWHLVTIAIAAISVAFALASRPQADSEIAHIASGTALAFVAWSFIMMARYRLNPLQFPQWALFLPVACLGLAGFWA